MSSAVTISNLALSHIGDAGGVTTISPPDGTKQSAECARFLPVATRQLLEARDWAFAVRRVTLADLDDPAGVWLFRYGYPASCARVSKILSAISQPHEPTEPFTVERNDSGVKTILTDVEDAVAVYVFITENYAQFSESATVALSWLLASYIAGPLIKGKQGADVGAAAYQRYLVELGVASTVDGSQHQPKEGYVPAGIKARA